MTALPPSAAPATSAQHLQLSQTHSQAAAQLQAAAQANRALAAGYARQSALTIDVASSSSSGPGIYLRYQIATSGDGPDSRNDPTAVQIGSVAGSNWSQAWSVRASQLTHYPLDGQTLDCTWIKDTQKWLSGKPTNSWSNLQALGFSDNAIPFFEGEKVTLQAISSSNGVTPPGYTGGDSEYKGSIDGWSWAHEGEVNGIFAGGSDGWYVERVDPYTIKVTIGAARQGDAIPIFTFQRNLLCTYVG